MAQHILNIAFDFDDDKVRETAERTVANEMSGIIKAIVTEKIAPIHIGWDGKKERDWSRFNQMVDDKLAEFIQENREEIISRAADKLFNSAKRTKRWKENETVAKFIDDN